MKEVNLSGSKPKTEKLLVNLTNTETGEVRKLIYEVRKLTGKASMQAQINLAEFAKDKKRDEIVGSLMIKDILEGTTPVDGAPDPFAILDEIQNDELVNFLTALMEAATGSTVTSD
jgi:hypothetical protein